MNVVFTLNDRDNLKTENQNFRLIFRFEGEDVYDLDYRDYH